MKHKRGYTLLEMMVVVAIVGILLAVSLPAYQSYMENSRRSVAGACLVELSQFMERVYTTSMAYNLNNGAATVLPSSECQVSLAGHYGFGLQTTATTFVLTATPTSTSSCGALTINQAGQRSANGDSSAAAIKKCW